MNNEVIRFLPDAQSGKKLFGCSAPSAGKQQSIGNVLIGVNAQTRSDAKSARS
jgi:hypothetical protein